MSRFGGNKMKHNILLVEDNEKSRKLLLQLLMEIDSEFVIYEADNIDTAYRYALQRPIHLFLLDIIIDTSVRGDVSGIIFASHIRQLKQYKATPIIFITSLEDPKLFAYSELHCYQFIEKPYDREKVRLIIGEALGIIEDDGNNKSVCFRKDGLLFPVRVSDILYITFEKPVVKIYQINDMLEIAYQPIHRVLYRLDSQEFLQCNRSTVVNKRYIENIDMVNGFLKIKHMERLLTLGNIYKKKFMRELENG